MAHKGHWGEYTGNAKWSRDHAHTRVTSKNYDDAVRDDAAHIDYLKRDVLYDDHHGHSDENMTADEKHISKLAGDMKYDKEHHGSPAKFHEPKDAAHGDRVSHKSGKTRKEIMAEQNERAKGTRQGAGKGSPNKHVTKFLDKDHPHNQNHDERPMHSHKGKSPLKEHKSGHEMPKWKKEANEKFQAKKDSIAAEKARLLEITRKRREKTYGTDQSSWGSSTSPALDRKGRKHWHKKEGESNTDFRNRISRGGKTSTSYENHPTEGWRKKN